MSKQDISLRTHLQREADESRPAFSESLHERISNAVRQTRVEVADRAANRRAALMARRRRALQFAAVACILCAIVYGWQYLTQTHRDPNNTHPQVAGPSAEDLRLIDNLKKQAATNLDKLVVSAMLKPETDELKSDARRVADTFLNPLPVGLQLASEP